MNQQQIIGASICAVGIVLAEHFGRIFDVTIMRPTYFIDKLTDLLVRFFRQCGRLFALISSFAEYLRLRELWTTLNYILFSLVGLFTSWITFFVEYAATIQEYMWHPATIIIGSIWIIASIVAIFVYFETPRRWLFIYAHYFYEYLIVSPYNLFFTRLRDAGNDEPVEIEDDEQGGSADDEFE